MVFVCQREFRFCVVCVFLRFALCFALPFLVAFFWLFMINVDVYIAVRSKRKYIEKWCSLCIYACECVQQQRNTFDGKRWRSENRKWFYVFPHFHAERVWKGNGGEMKKNRKEIFPVAVIIAHTRTRFVCEHCVSMLSDLLEVNTFPNISRSHNNHLPCDAVHM